MEQEKEYYCIEYYKNYFNIFIKTESKHKRDVAKIDKIFRDNLKMGYSNEKLPICMCLFESKDDCLNDARKFYGITKYELLTDSKTFINNKRI